MKIQHSPHTSTYRNCIQTNPFTCVYARLCVQDTAGQERFHALGPIYYRDSNGAVLVYDVTDEDSFQKVAVPPHEVTWHNFYHTAITGNRSTTLVQLLSRVSIKKKIKNHWLCCCNVGCQPQGVTVASVENKLQPDFLLRLIIADQKSIKFRFMEWNLSCCLFRNIPYLLFQWTLIYSGYILQIR